MDNINITLDSNNIKYDDNYLRDFYVHVEAIKPVHAVMKQH